VQFFELGLDVAHDSKNLDKHDSPNRRASEAQAIVNQVETDFETIID
jgi:hypothetical protein